MVLIKRFHALLEHRIELIAHTTGAAAHTLLLAASSRERDAAHTIVEQLLEQLATRHVLIADGEEEPITHWLRHVMVVHHMETIISEDFLHLIGTTLILTGIFHKVDFTLA